jgi:hypothetical protein
MEDWARWVTGDVDIDSNILRECVEGPISTFEKTWPAHMERMNPEAADRMRRVVSPQTPGKIYRVYFLGVMHADRPEGWEIFILHRTGSEMRSCCAVGVLLTSKKKKHSATIIELDRSSGKPEHMERDAREALQQIVDENYRNRERRPPISGRGHSHPSGIRHR